MAVPSSSLLFSTAQHSSLHHVFMLPAQPICINEFPSGSIASESTDLALLAKLGANLLVLEYSESKVAPGSYLIIPPPSLKFLTQFAPQFRCH